jgi:hypothetical protein
MDREDRRMSDAKADATNRAVFSVQIIALILKGLGDGTPVDPGVGGVVRLPVGGGARGD